MSAEPKKRNGESLLPFKTDFATRVIATGFEDFTCGQPAALQSVK
jgi:hypothetical protein